MIINKEGNKIQEIRFISEMGLREWTELCVESLHKRQLCQDYNCLVKIKEKKLSILIIGMKNKIKYESLRKALRKGFLGIKLNDS